MDSAGDPKEEIVRLQKRIERERKARLDAEAIAEKGTRAFYEKQKEVELLQAIAVAANQASAIEEAMEIALHRVCAHTGWPVGHAYFISPDSHDELLPMTIWYLENPERFDTFRRVTEATPLARGVGLPGRVLASGRPAWIIDVNQDPNFPRSKITKDIGVRAGFGFPVLVGTEVMAVLEFFSDKAMEPNELLLETMTHVGTQLGRVIERKRAEQALLESNRRLEEALAELKRTQQHVIQQERLRALGTMASGIAHDFNNALSPIAGFSELLLLMPEILDSQEKAQRYLQMINTAAQDAAGIVRRLREFYRRRDEHEVFLPVSLNPLVEQVVSLTQPKWKSQAMAHNATVDVKTDLQSAPTIAGNEAELREALTNLIFNAVDAMPGGGTIILRTRCEGEHVLLEVSDTGMGMTEEVRQRCLEPFFSTKGDRGTGLGLAMVFGILQRHEGTIDIRSEVGRGTTFIIRLPTQKAQRRAEKRDRTQEAALRSLHILVVDDEQRGRGAIVEYLITDGHTVEVATDGVEGLEKFQAGRFDLVITDQAMPEMSGDQMAIAIKRIVPDKPVIMMTGFGDMMQSAGERPEGVDFLLGKPVSLARLRETLVGACRISGDFKVETGEG